MSKRLQVVLSDEEYEELRLVSSAAGVTVSEWVRQALRKMRPGRRIFRDVDLSPKPPPTR